MLALLILIPILAAAAILLGAPGRSTAMLAALANLGLGTAATLTWQSKVWVWSHQVLDAPNINLAFGFVSGVSVVMLLLTVIVTLAAVMSGKAPEGREPLYYASSLLIAAGALGAFLSTDLFFFYAFHELALIPTFLMIGLLGRGERTQAAWKITIYLAFGSIILLAGLVWLANLTGTFSIPAMRTAAAAGTLAIPVATQTSIALLLLIGFGTLISLFPFHSWAAPAYASAPAPTAMLHAGVLKKFGLYGLLLIAVPLVPDGMHALLTPLVVLLLGNILWVGFVTVNQKRLDLMLGNSSVMHMGYIFLAIAAMVADRGTNTLALPAATVLMFAHGISIALLFALTDKLERRTGTLEIAALGGLAKAAPALAFLFGLASMASIGLPGLANFAGEVLVFLAAFQSYRPATGFGPVQIATILALWGVVLSALYMLRAFRHTFQGPARPAFSQVKDLHWCEKIAPVLLAIALLAVGLYPNMLLGLLR
jgi:NADH-quinone oxidoreductase subunit M